MNKDQEKFDRWIVASVLLHVAVAVLVVFFPNLLSLNAGENWGVEAGGDGAISVRLEAGGLAGIPLPAPQVVQENAAASESPSLYTAEPSPTPPAPPQPDPEPAVAIPAPTAATPPRRPAAPARRPPDETETPAPDNAVPYASGGRPAIQYGQFATGAGNAGVQFGDAAFGTRFGSYVQSMTRAISSAWLRGLVNIPQRTAPRVYLTFTIARDGSVSNITIKQSSGIPQLDRSADRAIRAADLPQLPSDYRGSNVTVEFYFEYVR